MHPRLSLLARLFEPSLTPQGDAVGPPMSFDEMLVCCQEAGATTIGCNYSHLTDGDLDAKKAALDAAGIRISYITVAPLIDPPHPETWAASDARFESAVEVARAFDVTGIHGTTGPRYPLDWEGAADAFVRGIAPSAKLAREAGRWLSIEPTNLSNADINFVHSLEDTLDLAERADIGVTIDFNHCGTERKLEEVIERTAGRLRLVQLCDMIPGTPKRLRAVPGDGVYPIKQILGWIFSTGYDGFIDLELWSEPNVPALDTARRAIVTTSRMLEELGV